MAIPSSKNNSNFRVEGSEGFSVYCAMRIASRGGAVLSGGKWRASVRMVVESQKKRMLLLLRGASENSTSNQSRSLRTFLIVQQIQLSKLVAPDELKHLPTLPCPIPYTTDWVYPSNSQIAETLHWRRLCQVCE